MTDEERAALQNEYPNWSIRRPANASYVIATRTDRRHVTDAEVAAGISMTLIEDTSELLGVSLAGQREIERAL